MLGCQCHSRVHQKQRNAHFFSEELPLIGMDWVSKILASDVPMLYDGVVISHILEKFSMLSTRYTFKIRLFDTQYIPIERQLLRKEYDSLLSRSIQE